MKIFIVVVALVALAFFAGWLRFYRDGGTAKIEVDGTEFREDTEHAIQESKELIDRGQAEIGSSDVPERAPETITP